MTSESVEVEIPFHRLTGRQTNIFNLICCKKQNKKVMVEILKKKKKTHTNPEQKLTIPGCRERREEEETARSTKTKLTN